MLLPCFGLSFPEGQHGTPIAGMGSAGWAARDRPPLGRTGHRTRGPRPLLSSVGRHADRETAKFPSVCGPGFRVGEPPDGISRPGGGQAGLALLLARPRSALSGTLGGRCLCCLLAVGTPVQVWGAPGCWPGWLLSSFLGPGRAERGPRVAPPAPHPGAFPRDLRMGGCAHRGADLCHRDTPPWGPTLRGVGARLVMRGHWEDAGGAVRAQGALRALGALLPPCGSRSGVTWADSFSHRSDTCGGVGGFS